MKFLDRLRANRRQMDLDLDPQLRRYLTPSFFAQHAAIAPLLQRYALGDVIDLGCGTMPFRYLVAGQAKIYDSLDIEARTDGVTYLGSIEDMTMIPAERYDAALCLEVLEHLPHPDRALAETARILKPGGWLVLSVPHLSRLHEEPNDYYRFTVHGVRTLLNDAGFEVKTITPRGGLLSFLGHQASTMLLASVWHVPVLRQVVWVANKWFVVWPCYHLDKLFDRSGLLALGYTALGQKPAATTNGQTLT